GIIRNNGLIRSILFFYQAEDGIRDGHVTGVQTCALPILGLCRDQSLGAGIDLGKVPDHRQCLTCKSLSAYLTNIIPTTEATVMRSEERRVGKSVDVGGRRFVKTKKYK